MQNKEIQAHYCLRQKSDNVYQFYIYDDISEYGQFNWSTWEYEESETSAKYFKDKLEEIPENSTIELHINSNGGSVKEGVAIYNQLKQKKCKEIVAYVDGVAYSIASVILQAADRRIMGAGTSLLIHNMWCVVAGNAEQLRKAADDLDVLMESNRSIYMQRATISEDELKKLMDAETYLTPQQAVEKGFADEIAVGGANNDTEELTEQMQKQISMLQKKLNEEKSFKEELKNFTQNAVRQQAAEEPKENKKSRMADLFAQAAKIKK